MKCILVTAGMSGGGTERVIAVLSNYLIKKDIEVTIIMTANSEIAYELDSRVSVLSIGDRSEGKLRKRLERILELRKLFSVKTEQVIVSFGTETNLFSIIAHLFLKNKLIISERNDPNQCRYKRIRDFIYSFANYHIFQTEAAKQCFSTKIQSRSTVIPNPIKENLPSSFCGEREKTVVAVGRLQAQKNHKLLLEAFAEFTKEFKEYTLLLYGKGELESDLRNQAEQMGISSKVVFKGFSDAVMEEIRTASMYVLSSDYEGISNSLLEAMAIGLPVISTDCPIGGSALLIQNEWNGLLIPVDNVVELSHAMKKIAGNKQFAQKISEHAQEVKEKFSSKIICEKWMEVIWK